MAFKIFDCSRRKKSQQAIKERITSAASSNDLVTLVSGEYSLNEGDKMYDVNREKPTHSNVWDEKVMQLY